MVFLTVQVDMHITEAKILANPHPEIAQEFYELDYTVAGQKRKCKMTFL